MVLHKFALLGGKVPAATGIRAAGRPPKAGRRTSFAAAAAPPGLRPAGCPENPAPIGRSSFRFIFYRKVFAFCGLCFFADFALFAAGTERIARPQKEKRLGHFYPPSPPVDFGPLRWGRKVGFHSRKGKAIGSFLATIDACRFWAFAVGKNSPHPPARARQSDRFYPLSPGSANCGVNSPPSRRRASSRAGCGGRAVK